MTPCTVVEIITPKKVILQGLYFPGTGLRPAERVIIFIHGLSSNAFSNHQLVVPLVDEKTGVITFNNRGHDKVSRLRKIDKRKKRGTTALMGGGAHEVFTDCVDDVQGVVDFAKQQGAKEIYLYGHSTGCQKAAYAVTKSSKIKDQIKGIILLSPMSDYAGALKFDKNNQLATATEVAKVYVAEGNAHRILPLDVWPGLDDAQRFLSLYTPESEEEIFSYCQPEKVPKIYKSISVPTLVILGEKDEYRDRPMKYIAKWFIKHGHKKYISLNMIPNGLHGFYQKEKDVLLTIQFWLKRQT